jgi:transposase
MEGFDVSELVPRGFVVESATRDGDGFVIAIRGSASVCRCPMCGCVCGRVHSQYRRRLVDLPTTGVRIALILQTRRFSCDAAACARRIFAERFDAVRTKSETDEPAR